MREEGREGRGKEKGGRGVRMARELEFISYLLCAMHFEYITPLSFPHNSVK